MEKNDKEAPGAIHGFLRHTLWQSSALEDAVSFTTALKPDEYPGYPFSLDVTVTYRLTDDGLTTEFSITNVGDTPAPVAAGFHPYFTVGSDWIDSDLLEVPFASYLEFDHLLPTGRVLSVADSPYDFRMLHPIGDAQFNTCYLHPSRDLDGLIRIHLSDPASAHALSVWLDQAFEYVVLYSGDPLPESHRRRALAIEPMTCASDAFNHPDWGLVALEPGQTFTGAWGVTAK